MSFLGNLYKPSFATVTGGVWNGSTQQNPTLEMENHLKLQVYSYLATGYIATLS